MSFASWLVERVFSSLSSDKKADVSRSRDLTEESKWLENQIRETVSSQHELSDRLERLSEDQKREADDALQAIRGVLSHFGD
jgi:mRNA-degrading endonuclease toxin of MazEF toxin-antitoxin module